MPENTPQERIILSTAAPTSFDPSGPAFRNNCFFSIEDSIEQAQVVFLSVPWDVTTSYRDGTRLGPQAILEASYQVDLYHPQVPKIYERKCHTLPFPNEWLEKAGTLRPLASRIIEKICENPNAQLPEELKLQQETINRNCLELNQWSEDQVSTILARGQIPITVGGDHAVSLGPLTALSKVHRDFSILHLDAHADLRIAYEGFTYSHASIMDEALKLESVSKLVQVGIRDVSEMEVERIKSDARIETYFDWDMKSALDAGISWNRLCQDIVKHLSDKVYISIDIDGFDPTLCPNTGTPVPGGLEFWHLKELLQVLRQSGRTFIGADLVEVSPDPVTPWNENVGARTLFELLAMT